MIMDHKLKLMVVDDSPLFRTWLIRSLSADDRFQIVGYAVNALDAQEKIPLLQPDMLTLDIEMPGMSGIDFLKRLLPVHPIPVILVSSLNLRVFDALEAGAVDFVRKPDEANGLSKEIFLSMLRSKLLVAAASHVHLPSVPASPQTAKKRIVSPLTAAGNPFLNRPKTSAAASQETVIAIGASTGGTEAILEVVKNFPENTPGVVITQHMPAGFTAMYAERLNRICKMEVREAKNGDRIRKGLMLLAPGGLQMRVVPLGNSYAVSVQEGEKVNGHRPSVDVLFDSVALHVREHAIGVLLTGMGADGAAGLLRMRKNGAYTIGQDKNSCVVYGMPMEAHKIGAVCQQCPLNTIGQTVLARLSLR
ncbi:chemotaxis response regulator protein-glutamate methylesterase [Clostridium sp.]|uniref:protein-glutamate methylesterase/protein-glutamine glutaminase n=1 Tax=Clostridium sp. TaxID=1506 RepID=UPI00307702C5